MGNLALKNYRKINKWSRAVRDYTLYGSSSVVRRATCIYCRNVIATCSNEWPETVEFFKKTNEHECLEKNIYALTNNKHVFNSFMQVYREINDI